MTEEQVFLSALDQPDAAARNAYLDTACAHDSQLRSKVEGLLAAHLKSGEFLDVPAPVQIDVEARFDDAVTIQSDVMPAHRSSAPVTEEMPFLESSSRPDSLGRMGRYEVLQVLGVGGFGIVLRAFDDVLERVVAVKVMAPQLAATSPARKRFLREARSSAQVRHENVVQVYEVGEQPLPHLVMEFIPGETLQQRIDRIGPLDVLEVLRIGRQIAEGLAAAHATDLIHRDIKPGNVLLEGGQLKVKITDFGLARAADDASMTQSGQIVGTPMYMAPEQVLGHALDQRADLFSLGTVMYQMVSGRAPFRAITSVAVLKRVAEDTPRNILEIIPETPQWLCDIIAKLHAKNPDDRYQSAAEVADVLADCEAQLRVGSKLQDFSRIPLARPTLDSPAAAPAAARPTFRLGGWMLAAALLLLVGVVGITEATGFTSLGGTIIRLLSPEGILVIEVDDPDVKVKIDGSELVITGAGAQEVRVKPGKYTVEATKNGKIVRRELVNITNNGRQVVRVSQEPLPPDTLAQAPSVVVPASATPVSVVNQKLPTTYANSLGMEFVLVPKGKSWLGGGKDQVGDQEVEIPTDFYLGKYEVTQEEWEQVMGANPSYFSRTGGGSDAVKDIGDADLKRFPVEMVSWDHCQVFAAKLNQREKQTGWVYRLPTAAEWEYACRGGPMAHKADSAFDFHLAKPTNSLTPDQANFGGRLKRTCKVGQYEANRLGLFDVHGNVTEWCEDKVDAVPAYRGGGWAFAKAWECKAAIRNPYPVRRFSWHNGLRLARVPADVPSPEARTPTVAVVPFTDAELMRIAALPAADQVETVRKELSQRNPGFDGVVEPTFENGVVIGLKFSTLKVTDISPVRALAGLRTLYMGNFNRGKGVLADLSPLQGMELERLSCASTRVSDLSPLKGMKLTQLLAMDTEVSDLTPLQGMPLKQLDLSVARRVTSLQPLQGMPLENLSLAHLPVRDLSLLADMKSLRGLVLREMPVSDLTPLAGLELRSLHLGSTQVSDLTPLRGMELQTIYLTPATITKGLDVLRDMQSLQTIGVGYAPTEIFPAAEFWQRYENGEFAAAPFTDADVQRIAALPATEQVEEVRKELVRLNPGYDGKLTPTIDNGTVTQLSVNTDAVTNIAPVRALTKLAYLDCRGTYLNKGKLSDLSPLAGTAISRLDCSSTQVSDLSPLADLPLTFLAVNHNPVSNLTPVKKMPLESLAIAETKVSDLSPLKGMQIKTLGAQLLPVTDLSPLEGMPLTGLDLYHTVGVSSLEPLKGMPLENLNLHDLPVSDLSPLKGMTTLRSLLLMGNQVSDLSPLEGLHLTDLLLRDKQVTDLSPLKGMPLVRLHIFGTGVSDLRPLEGMPLQEIRLTPQNITRGLDVLRSLNSLKAIGIDGTQAWPPAEFWDRLDKGEFNK